MPRLASVRSLRLLSLVRCSGVETLNWATALRDLEALTYDGKPLSDPDLSPLDELATHATVYVRPHKTYNRDSCRTPWTPKRICSSLSAGRCAVTDEFR